GRQPIGVCPKRRRLRDLREQGPSLRVELVDPPMRTREPTLDRLELGLWRPLEDGDVSIVLVASRAVVLAAEQRHQLFDARRALLELDGPREKIPRVALIRL